MPSAARQMFPARGRPAASTFAVIDVARPVMPPSAELIDAILAYADVEEEAGGGRLRRRVSAGRLAELEARGLIDTTAERAAEVAILWDEREGEIVRVLDGAQSRARARADRAWWETYFDEPRPRLSVASRREFAR